MNSLKLLTLVKLEKQSLHFLQKFLTYCCYKGSCSGEERGVLFFYLLCTAVKTLHVIPSSILFLIWYALLPSELLPTLRVLVKKNLKYLYWIILSGVWSVPENVTLTIHVLIVFIISIQNCFQTANPVIKNMQCFLPAGYRPK